MPKRKTQQSSSTSVQETTSGEKKVSVESLWREHLKENKDWAYSLDSEGAAIVYHWGMDRDKRDSTHWRSLTQNDVKQKAESFVSAINKYSKKAVADCAWITEFALQNVKSRLRETAGTSIACMNAVLFFREEGVIECRPIDSKGNYVLNYEDGSHCRGLLFDATLPVKVDLSRVKNGIYTPRENDATETGYWGKLIRGLLPDDKERACFQELFGDLLSKKQRKAMPVLLGDPNGGKSQVLIVAQHLVKNHAIADFGDMSGFEKEGWVGKRLITIDEAPKKLQSEDGLKKVIGGAGTTVRRKGKVSLSLPSRWKFIWALNTMPVFSDKSGALAERMRPFKTSTVAKSERVEEIGTLIGERELSEVLDWALLGLSRIEKRGRALSTEEMGKRSVEVLEETKDETNPARTWIREVELAPNHLLVSDTELLRLFSEWCDARGMRNHASVSMPVFSRDYFLPAMRELYGDAFNATKKRSTNRLTGNRDYCFSVAFSNLEEGKKVQRKALPGDDGVEVKTPAWIQSAIDSHPHDEDPFV